MSRVGRSPILIPQGVSCQVTLREVYATGGLGQLAIAIPKGICVKQEDDNLYVSPASEGKGVQALWGTTRSLLQNIIVGVHKGFVVNLEIEGVGYRAEVKDNVLHLKLGYSHDIMFPIPDGVQIECTKPTALSARGSDRQKVGQVVAQIMRLRKLEPYKGKGIRKVGQFVLRKEGKKK